MEKPIPPNPDTMTDEEFDRWLEAEFIWESEQIEKALLWKNGQNAIQGGILPVVNTGRTVIQ